MKISLLNDTQLLFQFPFNPVLSRQVKQLPNPQWLPPQAGWGVPYSPLAGHLTRRIFTDHNNYEDQTYHRLVPRPRTVPDLPAGLYDFQRTGARFLAAQAGAIANDTPGAGKTRQALAAAQPPALVICPASVVYHWQQELRALYPELTSSILRGRKGPLTAEAFSICSPALLTGRCRQLLTIPWRTVIVDEIHEFRNPDAKRTKALLAITTRVPHVIGVTGTLIVNRIADLFAPLAAIKQVNLHDRDWFERRYCGKTRPSTHRSRAPDGFTHEAELREYLKTCVLHRTRADLGRTLPPLTREAVSVDLANQNNYSQTESEVSEWLRICGTSAPPETQMIKLNKLRRLGAIGKVPAVLRDARRLLAAGESVVVACSFLAPLRLLERELPAIRLDGGVSKRRRQERVRVFQDSTTPLVALCSMKACGVGLTLTAARYVLILDLPWSPADLEQMEARIHRETQTQECHSLYYLGNNTTDHLMLGVLRKKARWANRLFEGGDATFIDPLQTLVTRLTRPSAASPASAAGFASGSTTRTASGCAGPA